MKKSLLLFWLLLSWPAISQVEDGQSTTMTMTKLQAVQTCLESNLDLKAAAAETRGYQHAALSAGTTPPAILSWQANTRFTNYSDNTVYLTQNFPPWGSQEASSRSGWSQALWSEQQLLQTKLKLQQQVKDAYVELLAAQERQKIASANAAVAQKSLELTQARHKAGAAPKLDLLSAEVESQRAQQELVISNAQLQAAQDALAPLMGMSSTRRILASGNLAVDQKALRELEPLLSDLQAHPKLAGAQNLVQRAKAQFDWASTQGNPSPGIAVGYDGNNRSPLIQLQLNIPIDWGQLASQVDQKKAAYEQAELQLQSQRLTLEAEIRQSWNIYRAMWQVAENYPTSILEPAERTVTVSSFGYERGAVPYLQLLTYQQRLFQVRRDNVEAQRVAWKALHALELSSGKNLEVLR